MRSKCSAPVSGHRKAAGTLNCPVHGRLAVREASTSTQTPMLGAPGLSADARREIADDPETPIEELVALAGDPDYYVRRGAARNPSTPVEVLAALSGDEAEDVRWALAPNPSTPAEVLAILTSDESEWVSRTAVRHSSLRMCAALDIDESNVQAIEYLAEQAWWDMTAEDPAVILAKALSPNA